MDGEPTWTDCDEAGDYVVPNVFSPRNLASRPDDMDETVPHKQQEGQELVDSGGLAEAKKKKMLTAVTQEQEEEMVEWLSERTSSFVEQKDEIL